jgi:hypothetical protein
VPRGEAEGPRRRRRGPRQEQRLHRVLRARRRRHAVRLRPLQRGKPGRCSATASRASSARSSRTGGDARHARDGLHGRRRPLRGGAWRPPATTWCRSTSPRPSSTWSCSCRRTWRTASYASARAQHRGVRELHLQDHRCPATSPTARPRGSTTTWCPPRCSSIGASCRRARRTSRSIRTVVSKPST